MCGIVGIWRTDGGEADRSAIDLMLTPIAHRGPDATGVWHGGRVAFGHLRLSILDLTEASDEPMLTADGAGILVYNGEVYNYQEIRRELEREGVSFRSSGDTEVVLQALHAWGPEQALNRFDGMFAFAYLDRREGALWLARDRIGIKPLHVAVLPSELIFASEVKALLAHPRMERRIDRHSMTRWLLLRGRGGHKVLFSGVDSLQPGSCWKITERDVQKRQYFHALTAVNVDRIIAAGEKKPSSFIEPLRDCLKRSVRLHLASDAPLAAMCSGGVDSSLIAAYAKQQMPDITAYVADVLWPGGEGAKAEAVGKHLGISVRRVPVDQKRFLELWPLAVWHSDSPPVELSDAALLAVAQACRADGIKVLLTGEGSDELFGGYFWQRATYEQWLELDSQNQREFITGQFLDRRLNLKDVLLNAPFTTMVSRTDRILRRRLTIALDAEGQLLPKHLLKAFELVKSDADRALLAHSICSLYHHLPWILHRHDRMGMAASIEMRVPFLANEMFDLAFHLPRQAKLQRGIGKWVVKRAASKVLPFKIVHAPKKGFAMPHGFSMGTQRMVANGKLAELMEWSSKTTDEIISWLGKDPELRFHAVGLELWARIFLDGEAPQQLGEKLTALCAEKPFRPVPRAVKKPPSKSNPILDQSTKRAPGPYLRRLLGALRLTN